MRRFRRSERGAALVEMVLVLPLLIVLAFGIIDVGRLLFTQITLNEAVQEGALYAASHPDDPNGARLRVVDSFDDEVVNIANVSVYCPTSDTIGVTLTHDVTLVTPWLAGNTMTLDATVESDVFSVSACVPAP